MQYFAGGKYANIRDDYGRETGAVNRVGIECSRRRLVVNREHTEVQLCATLRAGNSACLHVLN